MGGCKAQRLPTAGSPAPTHTRKRAEWLRLKKNTSPTRDGITPPWSCRLAWLHGVLLTQGWVFPVLLGPDSLRECMHRFLLQMETQLRKHLVPYGSRELSRISEVTVKMIKVLETASTKGSAVCHRRRMNRGRRSMNRWTVRGKLSPLITPEDLALGETARAPARSCYHLQREGLARPLLTLCLWQHLLLLIWVLIMYQED